MCDSEFGELNRGNSGGGGECACMVVGGGEADRLSYIFVPGLRRGVREMTNKREVKLQKRVQNQTYERLKKTTKPKTKIKR